jgi:hypothetical protein
MLSFSRFSPYLFSPLFHLAVFLHPLSPRTFLILFFYNFLTSFSLFLSLSLLTFYPLILLTLNPVSFPSHSFFFSSYSFLYISLSSFRLSIFFTFYLFSFFLPCTSFFIFIVYHAYIFTISHFCGKTISCFVFRCSFIRDSHIIVLTSYFSSKIMFRMFSH